MAPFSRLFKHLPHWKGKTANSDHASTNAVSTVYATDTLRPRTPQLGLSAPFRKRSRDKFASDSSKTTETTSSGSSSSTAPTVLRDSKDAEAFILREISKGWLQLSMQAILDFLGDEVYVTEKIVRALKNNNNSEHKLQLLLRHASSQQKLATLENEGFVAPAARAAALELFGVETGALLVLEFNERDSVSETKLQWIVSGSSRAVEVMKTFLNERDASSSSSLPKICLDERWLLAAVSNRTCGAELMSLIFQKQKDTDNIRITQRVLEAAMSNKGCVTAISEQLPPEHRLDLQITPGLLLAVCKNQGHAESEIDVLLHMTSGNKIRITEAMVQAASNEKLSIREDPDIEFFGKQRPENMMKKIIKNVVSNFAEVEYTTFALRALVGLEDTNLLEFILAEETPAKSFKITSSMVEAAAASTVAGVKVMELLLRKRGHEVQITERVLQATLGNKVLGSTLMDLFLSDRPNEVFPTERVMEAAAASNSMDMLKLLQRNAKDSLRITTKMVENAAFGRSWSEQILVPLLQAGKHDIQITAKLAEAASTYSSIDDGDCIDDFTYTNCLNTILEKGENLRISKKAAHAVSGIDDPETLALFLQRFGDDEDVKEAVLIAATTNIHYSKEILAMAIEQRWDNVRITTDMILAGTRNYRLDNLLALLEQFLRNGSALRLSEGALEAIMEHCSLAIIELVLNFLGDSIYIAPKVLEAVVKNEREGDKILKHLLDKFGRKMHITEAIIQIAMCNESQGDQILELLHVERPDEFQFTERWIEYAAQKSQYIWSKLGSKSGRDISERAVETAASDCFAAELMEELLSEYGDKIRITERTLEAAARNGEEGLRTLTFLLKALGEDIYITERIVEAAASNTESGIQILKLLMSARPKYVWITERVLEAAANNARVGDRIISFLFYEYGDEIVISERVLEAACSNQKRGDEIIKAIVRRSNRSLPVREKILEAAAGNASCGDKIVALLLDQADTKVHVTPKVLEAAAEGSGVVAKMLLKKYNARVQLTEDVVEACARDKKRCNYSGDTIMKEFAYHRINDIQLTERVNELIASTWPGLFLMLLEERREDVHVSERVLEEFARGVDDGQRKMMENLLRASDIGVTPRVVQAAVANERNGEDLIIFLLEEHGHKFMITDEIMKAAIKNKLSGARIIDIILRDRGRSDKLYVSEKLLQLAAQNRQSGDEIIDLLLQYSGDSLQLTDAISEAAMENEGCGERINEVFRMRTRQ